MQILNGAFHALSAQSGAVCDKLFLPLLAPNCRNHSTVEIREHFHEHLPMGGSYISKLKLWGPCHKVYEMFPSLSIRVKPKEDTLLKTVLTEL